MQLPPTVMSQEASKQGLSVTLLDRLVELYGEKVTKMLEVQYRMNKTIMEFSSKHLYNGRLAADPSVAEHLLCDLPCIDKNEEEEDEASGCFVLLSAFHFFFL